MARNILAVAKSVQQLVDLLSVDLGSEALKNVKIFENKTKATPTSKLTVETKSASNSFLKSIKIGNTSVSALQLPGKSQGQLISSPLAKALATSSQSFIPVLSIQQLQELLAKSSKSKQTSLSSSSNAVMTIAGQSSKVTTTASKVQSSPVAMGTGQGSQSSSTDSEQFARQW